MDDRIKVLVVGLLPVFAACMVEGLDNAPADGLPTGLEETRYEAEDRTAEQGCGQASNHAGYTGSGFMDYGGDGTWIEWNNIAAPETGEYTFTFRYANGRSGSRNSDLIINGQFAAELEFAGTGSWTSWGTVSVTALLEPGANSVRVEANSGRGGPNLDHMVVAALDLCLDDPDKLEPGLCGCGISEESCATCTEADEGTVATLACQNGETITSIDFASYGLPTGACDGGFEVDSCHAETSRSPVEAECLGQQTCTIEADNETFGDPCHGRRKRLAIVYTCGDGGGDAAQSECAHVDEGSAATLSCSGVDNITSIVLASYGTPSGSCADGLAVGTCHATTSKTRVEELCLNQNECSVSASNLTFGDPCAGVGKQLAITYTCGANQEAMSVFMLAGQSNMVGSVDEGLFLDLLDELELGPEATAQSRLESRLSDWYHNWNDGYAMYGYSEAMVAFEAAELLRLHGAGLVGEELTSPHAQVMCAMNDAAIAPLAPNCGSPFGPELMLGHYLATTSHVPTSLIKVVKGGTTLYTDWRSPTTVVEEGGTVGPYYEQLAARIQSLEAAPASVHPDCVSRQCRWDAFIWFQGENDSFDSANANAYEEHLTRFIADVRAQVGSPTLPVIIVQTGAWAQSMQFGSIVAAAQQSVVDQDPHAVIVTTDDLSGFYHYDPAGQLIIGERIGIALTTVL